MPNQKIVVISDCSKHEFKSKKEAIKFYVDCVIWSEGSARNRYAEVIAQLECGKTYCTDGEQYVEKKCPKCGNNFYTYYPGKKIKKCRECRMKEIQKNLKGE